MTDLDIAVAGLSRDKVQVRQLMYDTCVHVSVGVNVRVDCSSTSSCP